MSIDTYSDDNNNAMEQSSLSQSEGTEMDPDSVFALERAIREDGPYTIGTFDHQRMLDYITSQTREMFVVVAGTVKSAQEYMEDFLQEQTLPAQSDS